MNKRRNIAFIIIVLLTILIPIFLNNFAANVEKFSVGLISTNANVITSAPDQTVRQPTKAVLLFETKTIPLDIKARTINTATIKSVSENPTNTGPGPGQEAFTLSQSRMNYLNTSQSQYQQPQPLSQQSQTTQSQSQSQTSGGSIGAMYDQAVNFFTPSS